MHPPPPYRGAVAGVCGESVPGIGRLVHTLDTHACEATSPDSAAVQHVALGNELAPDFEAPLRSDHGMALDSHAPLIGPRSRRLEARHSSSELKAATAITEWWGPPRLFPAMCGLPIGVSYASAHSGGTPRPGEAHPRMRGPLNLSSVDEQGIFGADAVV